MRENIKNRKKMFKQFSSRMEGKNFLIVNLNLKCGIFNLLEVNYGRPKSIMEFPLKKDTLNRSQFPNINGWMDGSFLFLSTIILRFWGS
jgi:hypothetical protein